MLHGQDIICFANDWDGDPLSKKHVMTRLAKHNRILWVNSIGNRNPTVSGRDLRRMAKKVLEFASGLRRVQENTCVLTPLVMPVRNSGMARVVNEQWLIASFRLVRARLDAINHCSLN